MNPNSPLFKILFPKLPTQVENSPIPESFADNEEDDFIFNEACDYYERFKPNTYLNPVSEQAKADVFFGRIDPKVAEWVSKIERHRNDE